MEQLNQHQENEKLIDEIFKEARLEILNVVKIAKYGNINLGINAKAGLISNIYNIDIKKSKKV